MGVMGSASTTAVRWDLEYVVQINHALAAFRRDSIGNRHYATKSSTYQDKTAVMPRVRFWGDHVTRALEGAADEHITLKRDRFNHQSTISSQLNTYAF